MEACHLTVVPRRVGWCTSWTRRSGNHVAPEESLQGSIQSLLPSGWPPVDRPPNPGPASAQVRRLVGPRARRIRVRRLLGYAEDSGAGPGKASRMTSRTLVRSTALALLMAAIGIVVQILGGADYPAVPPGIIALLIAAGVVWFGPWRWAPQAGVVAGAFPGRRAIRGRPGVAALRDRHGSRHAGTVGPDDFRRRRNRPGVLALVRRGRSGAPT